MFRGAGWHVIKVVWGRKWDPLIERDQSGLLQKIMDEVCDGELQNCKFNGGAYTREHFFGKYPETLELVKDLSDEDIMYLNRGGHDPLQSLRCVRGCQRRGRAAHRDSCHDGKGLRYQRSG